MSLLISDLSISQDSTVTGRRRVGMGAVRRDAHRLDQKVMDTETDEGKIMKRCGKHGIGKKIMAPSSTSMSHLERLMRGFPPQTLGTSDQKCVWSGTQWTLAVTRSWIRGGKWLKSSKEVADGGRCVDQLSQVAASFTVFFQASPTL